VTEAGDAAADEGSSGRGHLSRREALLDIVAVIVFVPLCAIGAAILVGMVSSGTPNLTVALFVQALLVLGGVYLLLAAREQSFEQIGLRAPQRADVGRALIVLLAGFAVNILLTLAIVAFSPATLEEHIEGLETLALGLTDDTPIGAMLLLLLLVGFYEEVVARGLLLTRARQLVGGFWPPALISAALFALGHFYQGIYGVVQTALFGLVLAVFTLRWGTLWPAILAHAAINMLSVLQLGATGGG
jgi:membrane protease YdiL (CAAX protease family)